MGLGENKNLDKKAVSPVVSVILMVAITVILVVTVGVFVLDLGVDSNAATAGVTIDEDAGSVTYRLIDIGNSEKILIYKNGSPVSGAVLDTVGESVTISVNSSDTTSVVGELPNGDRNVIRNYNPSTGSSANSISVDDLSTKQESTVNPSCSYAAGNMLLDNGSRIVMNCPVGGYTLEIDPSTGSETQIIDHSNFPRDRDRSYFVRDTEFTSSILLGTQEPGDHYALVDTTSYDYSNNTYENFTTNYTSLGNQYKQAYSKDNSGSNYQNGYGVKAGKTDDSEYVNISLYNRDLKTGDFNIIRNQTVKKGAAYRDSVGIGYSETTDKTLISNDDGETYVVDNKGNTHSLKNVSESKVLGNLTEMSSIQDDYAFVLTESQDSVDVYDLSSNTNDKVTKINVNSNPGGGIYIKAHKDSISYLFINNKVYAFNHQTENSKELVDLTGQIGGPVPNALKVSVNAEDGLIGANTDDDYEIYRINES